MVPIGCEEPPEISFEIRFLGLIWQGFGPERPQTLEAAFRRSLTASKGAQPWDKLTLCDIFAASLISTVV
jgi:hypothetical protein